MFNVQTATFLSLSLPSFVSSALSLSSFSFFLSVPLSLSRSLSLLSQIRLTGGRARVEGRVEVLVPVVNGTKSWGLICGDGWTVREAMVVCRQLGLTYANSGLRVSPEKGGEEDERGAVPQSCLQRDSFPHCCSPTIPWFLISASLSEPASHKNSLLAFSLGR